MSSISEKLRSLDPLRGSPAPTEAAPLHVDEVASELEGDIVSTPFGECIVRSSEFPLEFRHGSAALGSLLQCEQACLVPLTKDASLHEIDFRKAAFLDTETTGLAGGTGTYAFLVGLGHYKGDSFQVDQIFMRDFHEEMALLSEVARIVSTFSSVVSYNGKCFDVPLLVTRYIFSRFDCRLYDLRHFDLLYSARRLWGRRLDNCSLNTVETEILGLNRVNDVPGWMVPSLYFEYLQTGRTKGVTRIFEHNLSDILSLVTLTASACRAVRDPLSSEVRHGLDLYSLGRLFDQHGDVDRSVECYLSSLSFQMPEVYRQDALRKLSFAYKRSGHWEEAARLWKQVIEESEECELYPYEELAKYYEHRVRDYKKAITIVERALSSLSILTELRGSALCEDDEADLRYRLDRLRRKERGEWSPRRQSLGGTKAT